MDPKIQKLLFSFFGDFKLRTFSKEKTILKPNANKIFFLTKGVVRMFGASRKKGEITINIYKSYSIFPMPLIFDLENKYTFGSLTETEGYFAPKKDFRLFIDQNNNVLLDLVKRIYQGLDGFFTQIEALLLGDAYLRVIAAVTIYARRFGKTEQNKIIFDWSMTHRQIASQTGLARESVTREIKKLQNKGLISYSGKKLFVNDLGKLEEEYFSYLSRIQNFGVLPP